MTQVRISQMLQISCKLPREKIGILESIPIQCWLQTQATVDQIVNELDLILSPNLISKGRKHNHVNGVTLPKP